MSFPNTPPLSPVPDTPPTPPLPPTPAPAVAKPGRGAGRSLFLLLLVPPALTITIIVVMRNMGSYGKSKLVGVIILCCLGLLVVIGAVATLLASVQDLRAAKRSGDRRAVRKQLDNLASMTCGVLVIAAPVLYFLTPAVIDLAQGPQARAVASCSYAQDTVTRSQWSPEAPATTTTSSCALTMAPSTPSPSPPLSRAFPSCRVSFMRSTKAASSTPTRRP